MPAQVVALTKANFKDKSSSGILLVNFCTEARSRAVGPQSLRCVGPSRVYRTPGRPRWPAACRGLGLRCDFWCQTPQPSIFPLFQWSDGCKKLKPAFESAAATLAGSSVGGKVSLGLVDAKKDKKLAKKFKVKGYPTLKVILSCALSSATVAALIAVPDLRRAGEAAGDPAGGRGAVRCRARPPPRRHGICPA